MKDLYFAQKLLDLLDEAAGEAKEGWTGYDTDKKLYYKEMGQMLEDWMDEADLHTRSKEV